MRNGEIREVVGLEETMLEFPGHGLVAWEVEGEEMLGLIREFIR